MYVTYSIKEIDKPLNFDIVLVPFVHSPLINDTCLFVMYCPAWDYFAHMDVAIAYEACKVGLWTGRDLYRATPAVAQASSEGPLWFSCLFSSIKGYWGPLRTRIPTDVYTCMTQTNYVSCSQKDKVLVFKSSWPYHELKQTQSWNFFGLLITNSRRALGLVKWTIIISYWLGEDFVIGLV